MQVAASRTGDLREAGGLEGALRTMMLDGAGTPRRLKTFIVEIDGEGGPRSRHASVRWQVRPSGVNGVSHVTCHDSKGRVPECGLLLDRRHGRFCMVHTDEEDGTADTAVSLLARTTQVGRAWVCPSVLGGLGGAGRGDGAAARGAVSMSREGDDGHAEARVSCDGEIAHAGGESAGAHLRIAGDIRSAFAQMCANAERFRIGSLDTPGGPRIDLRPIDMAMSRRIDDVPAFIDRTFDGSPPLHMRGGKFMVSRGQYHVPTVDLEGAAHMGLDVSPGMIHVGLPHGCSGSGVLRLLAHLQMHHDPSLACAQVTAGVGSA